MNGKFISGPAAIFVLLFFFLPWITVSCNEAPLGELSGFALAQGHMEPVATATAPSQALPLLFIVPIAGAAVLALLLLAWRKPQMAVQVAWGQVAITVVTLLILLWQYLQVQPEPEVIYELGTQPALWGTLLGMALVLIGAVLDIVTSYHTRQTRYSPSKPKVEVTPNAHAALISPEHGGAEADPDLFMQAFVPPTADLDYFSEPAKFSPEPIASIPPGRLSPKTEMLQPESNILAWLIVREGEETGKQHRLRENMLIGRDPDCDIIVHDSAVSGKHVRVYVENGRFFAADLNSTNGTFTHEPQQDRWSKIEEIEMKDGTQIKLGRTILHLMTLANK